MNPSEINLFPQASIFAGAPGINASTIQNCTRQNVQTLYLAWKETKDMAQLWLQKYRVFGTCPFSMETSTFGWPHRSLCGAGSIVSAWRGWLNLNCYQILPPWDRALGRGTDRNSLAEKAQSNRVRHNILRRGSISFKHWESLTAVVWRFPQLLIYLNSPSVMKIPALKKISRNNNNKKGRLQGSDCFMGTRLNSSSVYLLCIIPHLMDAQEIPTQP